MLLLQRHEGETIHIGENITVQVQSIQGKRTTLAIDAPRDVLILRGELREREDADTLSKPPRLGGCCCGEPCTLGVVHRTDGSCFVYEQPADSGRVGDDKLLCDVRAIYIGATRPSGDGCDAETWDRIEAALAAQGQGEAVAKVTVRDDNGMPYIERMDHSLPVGTHELYLHTAPPASPAGVPDAKTEMDYEYDEEGALDPYCTGHMDGWNDCRKAMLAAAPSAPEGGQ